MEAASESGLLEQLMSYDNGLQVLHIALHPLWLPSSSNLNVSHIAALPVER